ncbi:MAG: hypothetical protein M9962_13025 [Oligoflexia bacterium]|nr:hypothetical protein [Oligoflexia bacterium]
MKKVLLSAFLFLSVASVASAAEFIDSRQYTCEQVRAKVRASGTVGVDMYSRFGYSNVFAPRARNCRYNEIAEGAFVRTSDLSGPRLCAAGWTCVERHDHR